MSGKDLVEAALSDDDKDVDVKPLKVVGDFSLNVARRVRIPSDDFVCYDLQKSVDYPPSVTDQTHGLKLSEQIKIGLAQMRDEVKDEYDFSVGEKDDGREALGMIEWTEPAELSEAEHYNNAEIRRQVELQVEARKRAETEKTSNNTTDSEKSFQKPAESGLEQK